MRRITVAALFIWELLVLASPLAAQETGRWEYRDEWDLAWRIINFLILAVILYKVGKTPLKELLSARAEEIDREIRSANKLKAEAESEYQEIMEEVARADARIQEISQAIESQARAQKERILAEAKKTAERLIAEAHAIAEFELRKARQELRAELVEMAVRRAEERIREQISSDDQQLLVKEYVDKLSAGVTAVYP